MNIRSEIRLELIRDNLVFSCVLPINTSHEVALSVIEEFKNCVEQMKKQAEEKSKNSEPAE